MQPWLVLPRILLTALAASILAASYLLWQYASDLQLNSVSAQLPVNQTLRITKIEYHASFICGEISDGSGPLRPGFYDTDVNIYNKQGFTIPLVWKVVLNDGPSSNLKIKNLAATTSTSVSCEHIRDSLSLNSTKPFLQGFVVLRAELSPEVIGALYSGTGGTVVEESDQNLDVLNVQSIHTVNALKDASKQSILAKISFSITTDHSGKIPTGMLSKRLYIVVPIDEYQVFDPEKEVRQVLLNKFALSEGDAADMDLKIIYTNFIADSLNDDHALSVQFVKPVAVP